MSFLKKFNAKVLIISLLTLLIVFYAAYATANSSQKVNALNSSLSSLTDTIQYQKFFTINTPSSAPGGLNYLYYELPIRSSGSTLDPNTYLDVASITAESLEESSTGSGIFNVTNSISYNAADIIKATSNPTISGNPGMLIKFSPGLPCDSTGTATSCLVYTDPNTVPASARTFTASPQSRARVTVTLKLKSTAPTSTNGLFITEANWITPGGFPSDRVASVDQWNVALNYTAAASSSSAAISSVTSSTVSSVASSTALSSLSSTTSSISSVSSSTAISSSVSSTANSTSTSTSISVSRANSTGGTGVSSQRTIITVPRTGGFEIGIAVVAGLGSLASFAYLSRRKSIKNGTGDLSAESKKSKSSKK